MNELNRYELLDYIAKINQKTSIDLSGKNIENIDFDTFNGLANLNALYLNNNRIRELKKGIFDGVSTHENSYLYKKKKRVDDSSTLKGLINLNVLSLDNNRIEEIEVRTFESLSNLRYLYLSNNKIERIDSNTFKGLEKLEKLRLDNNAIEELDKRSFESLSNLNWLNLSNNKLKRIDSLTFKNLINLKTLKLDKNEIEELEEGIFDHLTNLEILWLNNNKLKWIDRKCFKALKSIHNIQLFKNNLQALSLILRSNYHDEDEDQCNFNITESDIDEYISFSSDMKVSDIWKIFLEQFEEPINEFYNPKLFIVDYYDSLISEIDIYTEELLEKYNENDLLEENPKEKDSFENATSINQYKIEYKNELMIKVTPGSTKIHEYLNEVRSKAIEEINKVKHENLERLEMNKDKYKYDRSDMTIEKVGEMKKELFKEKFCFLIKVNNCVLECQKSNTELFKLHLIVTDFYLEHYDRFLLGSYFNSYNLQRNSISFNLDKFCLILLSNCIYDLRKSYGNEVISAKKESLQKIQHIYVFRPGLNKRITRYKNRSMICSGNRYKIIPFKIDCKFQLSHGFQDFSNIKSIDVVNENCTLENLNVFTNLEYLSINEVDMNENMFIGLDKLIDLRCLCRGIPIKFGFFKGLNGLKRLDLSIFEINYINPRVFIHTPMLAYLRIYLSDLKIDEDTFIHLKNLKTIEFDRYYRNQINSNVLDTLRRSNIEVRFLKINIF